MAKDKAPRKVINLAEERQRRELVVRAEVYIPDLSTLVDDERKLNDRVTRLRGYLPQETPFYFSAHQPPELTPLYRVQRWGYDPKLQLWLLVAGKDQFDELQVWDYCYLIDKTQPWRKEELTERLRDL